MKKQHYWYLCCAGVFLLAGLCFTPLGIPANTYQPMLWGIPYTLWTSFLLAWGLVLLTFFGTRVHPGADNEKTL